MHLVRYSATSGFLGYELGSACGLGAMRGPPLFTRIDFAPREAAASSHFLATSTPARRFLSSSSQMSRGALFEMWCTFVPVVTHLLANWSNHFLEEGVDGSNSDQVRCRPPFP